MEQLINGLLWLLIGFVSTLVCRLNPNFDRDEYNYIDLSFLWVVGTCLGPITLLIDIYAAFKGDFS